MLILLSVIGVVLALALGLAVGLVIRLLRLYRALDAKFWELAQAAQTVMQKLLVVEGQNQTLRELHTEGTSFLDTPPPNLIGDLDEAVDVRA